MKTVADYLKSGVTDAALLLALVLGKTTAELLTNTDSKLNTEQIKRINQLFKQRKQGAPFAYLSGSKGFYNLSFKVTKDTLIPRPETELLIDISLDLLDKNKNYTILDLGTGSGVIAITLADICLNWKITATDFSTKALAVAKQNSHTDIEFLAGDWFAPLGQKRFDIIISNPPYIKQNDPCLAALSFEPQTALIAGKDGLDAIKIIIKNAPKHLNKNGFLLLEHGFNQQAEIVQLLATNFYNIQTFKDYNHLNRAILAQVSQVQ